MGCTSGLFPEIGLARKASTEIGIENDLVIVEVVINDARSLSSGQNRLSPV